MSTEPEKGTVEFPVKGSARPTGDLPPPEGPVKPPGLTPGVRPDNQLPEGREAREASEARVEPREQAGTHASEPGTPTRPSGEPLVPERDVVTPQDEDMATLERRTEGIHAHEWPPLVTTYKNAKDAPQVKRDDKDRVRTRDGLLVQKVDVESRERNKKERDERAAQDKKANEEREARERKESETKSRELATA